MSSIFAKNTNSLQRENVIGEPFIELNEVDSSNNYAMRQVQTNMAEHGAAWFAHNQFAGKGQRGKSWIAEPGQNIALSVAVEPAPLSVRNQFVISIISALASRTFFTRYALDDTAIKWPNDIYWKDKKAGGILIENIITSKDWRFSIIGIGININQTLFPSAAANAVSLKQITGKTHDPVLLAKELCNDLQHYWLKLKTAGAEQLLHEYNSVLYKAQKKVIFKKENARFEATVLGVNLNGDLLIDTGIETAIPFGMVEWVIT